MVRSFTTIGIDFKIRTIELDGKRIKLQIWDTAAYYSGAMGILFVNWIRNIEQHASDNVNKILVCNNADMDESKRSVPTSKGQALADECGIQFFETHLNVEQVFFRLRTLKLRPSLLLFRINQPDQAAPRSSCCRS